MPSEIYRTDDQSVAKFIHPDGSETAIKCVLSQSTFVDPDTRKVEVRYADRHKYSVFISASTGCYLKCPFCHLTIKDCQYRKLTASQVLANLKEAISLELEARPELGARYVKLCWMGMGDALNQPTMVREVTLQIMDWILDQGFARGLDSVDLSTVMPDVPDTWIAEFAALTFELARYPLNPASAEIEQAELSTQARYRERSTFRLFYSLHSAIQSTRDRMAPRTTPLTVAIPKLHELQAAGVSVLLHQVFVEGLNDRMEEIDALVEFLAREFPDNELRVLRYNFCDRSPFKEWGDVIPQLGRLLASHKQLKVQISAGKEVQAACGQFLVAQPRRKGLVLQDATAEVAAVMGAIPA